MIRTLFLTACLFGVPVIADEKANLEVIGKLASQSALCGDINAYQTLAQRFMLIDEFERGKAAGLRSVGISVDCQAVKMATDKAIAELAQASRP